MNLKLKKLKKLNKREFILGILTLFTIITTIYWYVLISPMLKKEIDLNTQIQNTSDQLNDLKSKLDNTAVMQQQKALLLQKEALLLKINNFKNKNYLIDTKFISHELSTLGNITNYEFNEISRNNEATKYILKIEHSSNYVSFMDNIRRIEKLYPEVHPISITKKKDSYISEWSIWLKQ